MGKQLLFVALLLMMCGVTTARADDPAKGEASPSPAHEEAVDLDDFLAKWEEASNEILSIDARLTVYRYDRGKETGRNTGRIYFEAPGLWHLEQKEEGPRSKTDKIDIWNERDVILIDRLQRSVQQISRQALADQLDSLDGPPEGFFGQFIYSSLVCLCGPDRFFPVLFNIDEAYLRQRFELKISKHNSGFFVTAIPKLSQDEDLYERLVVLVDPHTYRTKAIRVLHTHEWTTYSLSEIKVNIPPSDRQKLLHPDLESFTVERIPVPESSLARSAKKEGESL